MVHHVCPSPASAGAVLVFSESEKRFALPLPLAGVTPLPSIRALLVKARLPLSIALLLACAGGSAEDGLSATADASAARRHQATGRSATPPRTAMMLAKIEVPLPFVRTGRT